MRDDLVIRAANDADHDAIWKIMEPVIRDGTTYPLDPAMNRDDALLYWFASDKQVFVADCEGEVLGTYYLKPNNAGPGDHVANAGFMTHVDARGRGVAKTMANDCFERAKLAGYHAMQFNLVIASNLVAVSLWQKLGLQVVGRLPQAFRHKRLGLVDALVMYRPL